jgi:F0F1-type ATP synthase assembly protein I
MTSSISQQEMEKRLETQIKDELDVRMAEFNALEAKSNTNPSHINSICSFLIGILVFCIFGYQNNLTYHWIFVNTIFVGTALVAKWFGWFESEPKTGTEQAHPIIFWLCGFCIQTLLILYIPIVYFSESGDLFYFFIILVVVKFYVIFKTCCVLFNSYLNCKKAFFKKQQ